MMNEISRTSILAKQDTINPPKKKSDTAFGIDINQAPQNINKTVTNNINSNIKPSQLKDTIAHQPLVLNHYNNDKTLIDNYYSYSSLSANKDSNCYIINKEVFNQKKTVFYVDKNEKKTVIEKDYVIKERVRQNNDWTIVPIVIGLFLLASIVTRYRKYLSLLFDSIIYRFSANKIFNERNNQIQRLTIILDILYLVVFSLVIDQIVKGLNLFDPPRKFPFIVFVAFLAFLIILRLFRLIVFKLSGLFSIHRLFFKELFSSSLVYTRTLGLFLLPLVFLITYSTGLINTILIYSAVFVVFIMLIMRIINMFRAFILGGFSIFYFILYLCALEILPLLVIWKEVKSR